MKYEQVAGRRPSSGTLLIPQWGNLDLLFIDLTMTMTEW